jgi:cytochrome bd ubiquinol oxidase subunit II
VSPEPLAAGVLAAALVAYVLTGLADFGGGVWDLVATGPRAADQRRAIARAIGPIWEANHVWLILALVVTFVCFPLTFAAISTALHVPLTLMLVGTVLRGAAFAFRAYDSRRDTVQLRWSRVFAVGSIVAPIGLGLVVGAITRGAIDLDAGEWRGGWFATWMAPFPAVIGLLTLAIAAYLAAVYLTLDTRGDGELQELFRTRGLYAAGAVFVLAWMAFFLARSDAPLLWEGLWASPWAWPLQVGVAVVGLGSIGALAVRRWQAARALAAAQTVLVVAGWAASMWPHTLPPDLTVHDAAPPRVIWAALGVLAVGTPPLLAAYAWLMHVFGKDRLA